MIQPLSYAESDDSEYYTEHGFFLFFIENNCYLPEDNLGMPFLVLNPPDMGIDVILKHYPGFDYSSHVRYTNHEDRSLLWYEIDHDQKILIMYDTETRYITGIFLIRPACSLADFAGITIGKTTLEQVFDIDPNAYHDILLSWQRATYHYVREGLYIKITYELDHSIKGLAVDTISIIDSETAAPFVRIIGEYLESSAK